MMTKRGIKFNSVSLKYWKYTIGVKATSGAIMPAPRTVGMALHWQWTT